MRLLTLISSILMLASGFSPVALAADAAAWKTRSIYFVLTDRFAKTSSSDTSACNNLGTYCGGTWKGMEQRLDYIKGLGFDAIWITPVVENTDGGYHGYWAKNLYNVNSNHGTAADLKSLISTAHSKDMYIMVDVVANHMGRINKYDDHLSALTPFSTASSYHDYCVISDYSNQSNVEVCRIVSDLPDLKTEDSTIRSTFQAWIKDLVATYNIDGLRIDTVKHVEKSFWPPFVSAAGGGGYGKIFATGEVYHGDPAYVGPYQNYLPSLVNFPMYYAITDSYARKTSMQVLVDQHNKVSTEFSKPELLPTFLDNHDVARFLNVNPDWTSLKNALAYTLLGRGIPTLYGGTEQGYKGGADPANREDLWRSGYNTSGDLYMWIAKAMAAKKSAGGLGDDDHVHLYVTSGVYAFSRAGGKLVVVTTNGGSGTSGTHCFRTKMKNGGGGGTVFKSVLGSGSYTADGNGQICVAVVNGQPEILLS